MNLDNFISAARGYLNFPATHLAAGIRWQREGQWMRGTLPAFLFAMYEKDGLPLEKVLKNMITVKFIRPPVRKYQMENMYEKKYTVVRKKKGGTKSVKKKKR